MTIFVVAVIIQAVTDLPAGPPVTFIEQQPVRQQAPRAERRTPRMRLALSSGLALSTSQWLAAHSAAASEYCVVLIHGFSDLGAVWDSVAPRLAEHCDVLAPDLRGHGESDWDPEGQYDIASYGDDLMELILTVGPKRKVILVGHSMGGSVALYLCHRMAECVAGLILLDCPPVFKSPTQEQILRDFAEGDRNFSSWQEYYEWLARKRPLAVRRELECLAAASVREVSKGVFRRRCDPAMALEGGIKFDLPEDMGDTLEFIATLRCRT